MATPSARAQMRRSLLLELAALQGKGDVLEWQRRVADAIIDAENPPSGVDRAETKRHKHLLRVITDGLVHALLPEHTIRSLSHHPGKPPSLSSQGADFDFVFEQAARIREFGFIPIIADLTTLVGVGDIVGIRADGDLVVLECKNRPAPARPATTGRHARQRHRGEHLETYLSTSQVEEAGGVRQAVPVALPSPDWDSVADLLDRCSASPSGTAACSFGPGDTLLAATPEAAPEDVLSGATVGGDKPTMLIAFYADLIDSASHRRMAPSSYPVSPEHRVQLLEGDLLLMRIADSRGLAAEFDHGGSPVALVPDLSDGQLTLRIDVAGQEHARLTHELAELALWMPIPLAGLRDSMIEYTRTLLDEERSSQEARDTTVLAPGDNVTYMTVYRSG